MLTRSLNKTLCLGSAVAALASVAPAAAQAEPTTVHFDVAGTDVSGRLYAAASAAAERRPVIVMAHGFGLLQADGLAPFADRFAAEGYNVLTFDYRSWGSSGGQPRNVLDVDEQRRDYRAAADYARTLPGSDGRVVLWGSSFSGGHVLDVAGRTRGITAVISQAPHVNGVTSTLATAPQTIPGLIGAGLTDLTRAALRQTPRYVATVGRPGQFAALTQPGAYEGYQRLTAADPTWPNRLAARIIIRLPFYSPDAVAARSNAPTFIGIERRDNVTPPGPAVRLAVRMGATLRQYDNSHFDVYFGGPDFDAIVADELAFLAEHAPIR